LSRRLGVIIAPAGFGKTTLMVQWQARLCAKGAQVGWLSCDEEDGDPLQLLSYMILALAEAGVDLGALRGASERGMLEGAVRQTTAEVLEKIEDARGDVVLILDDYHRLGTREADKLLIQLLDAAPPNFTIVLSTRAQPKFDLARLLAIGWASEFDAGSLRLSKQELGEAFDRALTPAERDILFERTEGWIIAVQLARLMMEEGQSIEACLASFKGDVGHIATYLAEQVLGNLPEDLQNFLIETSVLDAFNASLADALVIRNDSADVLKRLEPLSALLSPISDQPGWYRYHQLFAECLQDLQRRRSGADTSQLHLRASMWFEKRGDVVAAVNHASEAADFDRCARLIEEAGGWRLILFGGIGYLRNLLKCLPDAVMQRFPRLQIAKAYLCAKNGDLAGARAFFNLARANSLEVASGTALSRDLLNIGALLHIYEDRHLRPPDLEAMSGRIRRLQPGDPLTVAILDCEYILANISLGRFDEAERRADDASLLMQEAQSVLGLNYTYLHAGTAALYQGDLSAAEAHFDVSLRMAAENFDSDPGLKALSGLHAATLKHWRGRIGPDDRPGIMADIEYVEAYDGWFELYANGLLLEAALEGAATTAVGRARRIAAAGGLDRLRELADVNQLRHAAPKQEDGLASRIIARIPRDIWRIDPFRWRPFLESRIALACYLSTTDRTRALEYCDAAIACSREIGVIPFLIDGLVVQAELFDLAGDRGNALHAVEEALALAAPEGIWGPFERSKALAPTLRAYLKSRPSSAGRDRLSGVATMILERLRRSQQDALREASNLALSQREYEVVGGLVRNQSNKEIARSLDVSEHTVKFHLKNIFAKLGVERRAQAIAKLSEPGLL